MRIGMATACYEPLVNGVTRMISHYKYGLEEQGHSVCIFTLGGENAGNSKETVFHSKGAPLGNTGYHLSLRYHPAARLKMGQMDILHCHHLAMSLEFAHRYGNAPIVYTNHTRYDLYTGVYSRLPQPAANAIMRLAWRPLTDLCQVVIAPSRQAANTMRRFGVRRPIEIIPNGIDLAPFFNPTFPMNKSVAGLPASATPIFVYAGRLAKEKNLSVLIRQFADVCRRLPAARLLMIGRGNPAGLKRLAQALDVAGNITFVGEVEPAQMPAWLQLADIFVTPSLSEVHPLTIIEAMAAGLPVVGIDAPGVGELVGHGQTGLLAETPARLGETMAALGENLAICRQFGAAGRRASRKYAISATTRRTLDLYAELILAHSQKAKTPAHAETPLFKITPRLQKIAQDWRGFAYKKR